MEIKLLTVLDPVLSMADIYVDLTDYKKDILDEQISNGTISIIKIGDDYKRVIKADIAINRLNSMMTNEEISEIISKSNDLIRESINQLIWLAYFEYATNDLFKK